MSFNLNLPLPLPHFHDSNDSLNYLIVDGSQIEQLEPLLQQQDLQPQRICPTHLLPLAEVSPYIMPLTPEAMAWFVQYNKANIGYVISSEFTIDELIDAFCDYYQVLSAYGSTVFFKLGQPEAIYILLSDKTCLLWQWLTQAWLPTREGWEHVRRDKTFEAKETRLPYRLSDVQWALLGEISRRNCIEMVHQHLLHFFPTALEQHAAPLLWIKGWVEHATTLRFETDVDVLHFFNILALLGEEVIHTDRYLHIRQLLETPSEQTPSMRVAMADKLAHKEAVDAK
ncbi:DUF4123 domain-containing protein [Photobacterium damselae]|uniref:DUF4123 domain-containing protein n=1 Tax=Photobacterium damselae TaxID=38293 RepID=UPI002543C20C